MKKYRIPFERKPIFLLVDAYRKAGGVTELAKQLGISDSAIYNWFDGIHGPNYESIDALRHYLYDNEHFEHVEPVAPVIPDKKPKAVEHYARPLDKPNTLKKVVEITKVFLGGSGKFVAFGITEKSSVFITPLCVRKIAEQVGSIYEGDEYEFEVIADITNRSDYITHRYIGPA